MYAATTPVNRVKPAINFIRVQHETWPTPKKSVGLVASVYICQGDRWLTIRDNGNITGHWRTFFYYEIKSAGLADMQNIYEDDVNKLTSMF